MASADVTVFLTTKAYNNDSKMQDKVENYLKEAFEYTVHSATVKKPQNWIDAPSEDPFASFEATVCGNTNNYDGLLPWWKDYHKCNSLTSSEDAIILITNNTGLGGEGYVGGRFSVSAGEQISSLSASSTYQTGCDTGSDAMQTVIHEVGHNLGLRHADGYAYNGSDGVNYYTSNMMNGYTGGVSTNNCGRDITADTSKDHCHDFGWFDCEEEVMYL